ncbi:hypothetical protein ACFQVC_16455 [Streptomyces monticola]|uniref:Apoptosis regulator Bcl-2 family BH4 domain-containing protein n=1 Tax=Streptomyces monticola TaxID=2666263 RepID=A0ABW2JID4_9ACTN
MKRGCVPFALVMAPLLALTGCGGIDSTAPTAVGAPASGLQSPGTVAQHARLFFVGPYGNQMVSRPTDSAYGPQQALDLLVEGPTEAERERGLISQVPPMHGQLKASGAKGAVDLYVPYRIAEGGLDWTAVSQLACTAASAELPGDVPPPEVDVRMHEEGESQPWTVRCSRLNTAQPAQNQDG